MQGYADGLKARVWVFGDNISTDQIIAGKRLGERDIKKLASFTFENIKKDFAFKAREGDIIVGGKNFGCGSSREQAVLVLKALNIKLIIAQSFGRIFQRNCINNGILPLKTRIALRSILKDLDTVEIDFENRQIRANNFETSFEEPAEFLYRIWKAGGLIEYLKHL